jgi:hypothetical protein
MVKLSVAYSKYDMNKMIEYSLRDKIIDKIESAIIVHVTKEEPYAAHVHSFASRLCSMKSKANPEDDDDYTKPIESAVHCLKLFFDVNILCSELK